MNVQRYASICMFFGLSLAVTWRIFYTNFAQYTVYVQFVLLLLGKGLGLRWRLGFEIKHLLTKHLTILSAHATETLQTSCDS